MRHVVARHGAQGEEAEADQAEGGEQEQRVEGENPGALRSAGLAALVEGTGVGV